MSATFRERHPELRELMRELALLRAHNLKFKDGDPQDTLLMFAEGALVVLVLERFLRAILPDATEGDTLYTLLERAASKGLIRVPWDDQKDGIAKLKNVRNTLLHGNYEQAAREAKCPSVAEYFKTQYASEIDAFYKATDFIVAQIDPDTGQRRSTPAQPTSTK